MIRRRKHKLYRIIDFRIKEDNNEQPQWEVIIDSKMRVWSVITPKYRSRIYRHVDTATEEMVRAMLKRKFNDQLPTNWVNVQWQNTPDDGLTKKERQEIKKLKVKGMVKASAKGRLNEQSDDVLTWEIDESLVDDLTRDFANPNYIERAEPSESENKDKKKRKKDRNVRTERIIKDIELTVTPDDGTEDKKKREFSIDFNLMNDFGDRSRTYVAIRRRLEENEFVSSIEHIGPKK